MPEEHGSWLQFLYGIRIGDAHLLPHWVPQSVPLAVLCALVLAVVSYVGTRRMRLVPSGLQALLESAVNGLTTLAQGILGAEKGKHFAPFIGTLFLYILFMNLLGLVPGMKSPTADLNTTIALALVVFFASGFYGMRSHGVLGYFKHMVADVLDLPLPLAILLTPFMLTLHLISVLVRPLSLAMRLFGNIMGKEVVLSILAGLATATLALFGLHVAGFEVLGNFIKLEVPAVFGPLMLLLTAVLMPLAILMGVIQALVFSLLACLYLLLDTAADEGAPEHA
ncbi:MAG TPA: F0F1 ATP synthase subunit A [Armatimonadota bacterium]|nr:F0F1 ATP synthase subunit A [Armatimonadota bacterium]